MPDPPSPRDAAEPAKPSGEWASDLERVTELSEGQLPPQNDIDHIMLVCRRALSTWVVDLGEGEQLIVGRGPESEIRVEHPRVSRRHSRISLERGIVYVEDLASRNGTALSGRILRSCREAAPNGACIQVADCEILVAAAARSTDTRAAIGDDAEAGMVLADPLMEDVLAVARKVARTPTSALILGETGAGKDVLARRIHAWSTRSSGPFVRINCAAMPETLLESELFGHEKGAFTGADRRKIGFIEAAGGGTLFIDEVGELPPAAQVKLLNALETRTVVRLGSTAPLSVDIRLVCATHRDLQEEVARGRFRADLYYRISSFVLRVPPLRERKNEISVLSHLFAGSLAEAMGDAAPDISERAAQALAAYAWPGNIRELRNAIEHAMVLAEGGTIDEEHLPAAVRTPAGGAVASGLRGEMGGIERRRIEAALEAEGGNQTRAAVRLGMSRRTLVYKLARWRRETD